MAALAPTRPLRKRDEELDRYINLKLAALGLPVSRSTAGGDFLDIAGPLLRNYHQKDQQLGSWLCPADRRVQDFLDAYLSDVCPNGAARLPANAFVLDREGMARVLSLPVHADHFSSPYLKSYRLPQGVLHNPHSDKRTTQGIFHVTEGGLPVPADKEAIPKQTFAALWNAALRPPAEVMTLPFTTDQEELADPAAEPARCFVSLLLRPLVCPATGTDPAKTMEIRFFVPGSLVSNLDFVEGIFGNAGDPYLPENDAGLDAAHWTGHTGCVVLAPHLVGIPKKAVGLPHISVATERQKRDGMCWTEENEPYNGGRAFKATCRDARGVMVTIIADNYYGYCKKEVKTQISFAANLYGACEEEHAGGAMAFATYVIGLDFYGDRILSLKMASFADAAKLLGDSVVPQEGGYAIDRKFSNIFYVPQEASFHAREGVVKWKNAGGEKRLPLRAGAVYVLPNGFRIRLQKQISGTAWRLIGARPRGTFCHKPCTVSGGGKSEISKSMSNVLLKGPVFVRDYNADMDQVEQIFKMDFSGIYRDREPNERSRRPVLSMSRSLGSVIQLLTPAAEYTDEHNDWLRGLGETIRQLVFTVKRYYQPEWGDNWREHFTVDRLNGYPGHELKFDDHPLVANYLRVGYDPEGAWRVYKLRADFSPSEKVQMEDDISASVVLPREALTGLDPEYDNPSVKLVANCERLLFQRPDDAIYRGTDRQAEADIAGPGNFLSNYEPISVEGARAMVEHVVEFDQFTEPMKELLGSFAERPGTDYVVSSAHPRVVNGKRSTNPRYLQRRPDMENPQELHLAEMVARLARGIPAGEPVYFPVNAVLAGRRNSPADEKAGLPPLAVHGPIHYQELPELFMDFISSLTGKSPATTGFGSEGALTKAAFNALPPVVDLNNALVSFILTGHAGFTTSAGYIGPNFRVDHDVSLLVPEIWCRMRVHEREPEFLKAHGYLEKVEDFTLDDRLVLASRLGYRITPLFVDRFLGRMFETPDAVFTEEMLRPEQQDTVQFAAGVDAIVETQTRVAKQYFEDGSVEAACPPLKALLYIMAEGSWQGKGVDHPEVRGMFTREYLMASEWYRARLRAKQTVDVALWGRHVSALEQFRESGAAKHGVNVEGRLEEALRQLARVSRTGYLKELEGTLGADPYFAR